MIYGIFLDQGLVEAVGSQLRGSDFLQAQAREAFLPGLQAFASAKAGVYCRGLDNCQCYGPILHLHPNMAIYLYSVIYLN